MAARKGCSSIASLSREEAKAVFPRALDVLGSHYLSKCLSVAIRLDVPTIIGKSGQPLSTEDILKETGKTAINADYMKRIMRYLSSEGIFKEHHGSRFSLTNISQLYRSDVEFSIKDGAISGALSCLPSWWNTLGLLEDCVLSKTHKIPFNEANGKPFFDYLAERPKALKTFNSWMTVSAKEDSVKDFWDNNYYKWSNLKPGTRVMDVGGGEGSLMRNLKASNPDLHCIVFDLPQVINKQPKDESNVEFMAGDFFDPSSLPKVSMIVLKRILHDWADDDCVQILKSCVSALPKGGKLLIVDFVIPEPGGVVDKRQMIFDVMMMMIGGKERTLSEWKSLFALSGLEYLRFIPDCLIIETEKI